MGSDLEIDKPTVKTGQYMIGAQLEWGLTKRIRKTIEELWPGVL